ncbi:YciI family protein [Salinispora cortesiana]|uniref:YciI family protein n=1 Tax=Salinispora cortesiana TaxID=1305843 RepID=UPI000429E6B1|nr:YciI family protein [Salinispora cortesiana]
MKYLMLVCAEENLTFAAEEEADLARRTQRWVAEMDSRGVRLHGSRLQSVEGATTVRVRDGAVLVADGPFAETKEHVAGYDLLECADLEEAIEVASKHPAASFGTIEVRAFWQP